ncbi:hypothetical protein ANRL2_00516 [Anaerolineae bacterium]|nr:hypothetical protein ANRL2_00516 [Anaerolineae bacterium]
MLLHQASNNFTDLLLSLIFSPLDILENSLMEYIIEITTLR